MAKHRALKIGATVPVVQMEATDAVDNPINVSGPDVFLGRITSGEGGHEELTEAGITEETTPAAGDFLLGFVGGAIRKMDVGNLPGGGGGLTVSQPMVIIGRTSSGAGPSQEIKISELDLEAVPASGQYMLCESGGDLRKMDVIDIVLTAATFARPYTIYTALLSQSGTDDPTAVVLENTLGGTVVWTRDTAGQYYGTLTGAFTENKTVVFLGSCANLSPSQNQGASCFRNTDNDVFLVTAGYNDATFDDLLQSVSIEIRVYP